MNAAPKVEYVSTNEEIVYALTYLSKKKIACEVTADTKNAKYKLNEFIADGLKIEIKESLRRALRQFRLRKNVKNKEAVTGITINLPISKSTVGKMMNSLEIDKMDKNKFRRLITNLIKKEFE
ncbi:hypothetical protein [Moritella sp. F3]|uniref:hypothetical protein n=1 Tax=Moritella sp. F3 TaxID=2718882 RepID=UPI0018E17797|nr:hypothetical protein [Moritella sp. F3]